MFYVKNIIEQNIIKQNIKKQSVVVVSCFTSKMRGFMGLELGGGHPVAAKQNEENAFSSFFVSWIILANVFQITQEYLTEEGSTLSFGKRFENLTFRIPKVRIPSTAYCSMAFVIGQKKIIR